MDLETANRDLAIWLKAKEQRRHGTTQEKVSLWFEREKPHLIPLPSYPFDTSYRIYWKVGKDCTVRFACNSYVVPHTLVGEKVVLRVKDTTLSVFDRDHPPVTYEIPEGTGHLIQDKKFYEALR